MLQPQGTPHVCKTAPSGTNRRWQNSARPRGSRSPKVIREDITTTGVSKSLGWPFKCPFSISTTFSLPLGREKWGGKERRGRGPTPVSPDLSRWGGSQVRSPLVDPKTLLGGNLAYSTRNLVPTHLSLQCRPLSPHIPHHRPCTHLMGLNSACP